MVTLGQTPSLEDSAHDRKKEFAKKMRREAYLRAKEYRKIDPRQIAMTEKLKQKRREAYQKVKESRNVLRAERKEAAQARRRNHPGLPGIDICYSTCYNNIRTGQRNK